MAIAKNLKRQIDVIMGELTGPAARGRLATVAKESLREVIRTGEGNERYDRFVNGREGVSEEQVHLPGPILYRFNWLNEVAEFAIGFLKGRWSVTGPGRGGHFKDKYFIMSGGKEIPIEDANKYNSMVITNDMPYARKAQIGAKGFMVPRGMYHDCAKALKRHFGAKLLGTKVIFVTLNGGYVLRKGQKKTNQTGRSSGEVMRYPALRIWVK